MVGLCEHGETIGQRVLGDLHEDPPLEIERSEDVPVGQEHLGAPGEEKAAVIQGKVKPGQDPRLRLVVEVHQRVAAQQQIDPGDRWVLNQVVPAKDHRAPRLFVEAVAIALLIEVLFHERTGDISKALLE